MLSVHGFVFDCKVTAGEPVVHFPHISRVSQTGKGFHPKGNPAGGKKVPGQNKSLVVLGSLMQL